MAEQRLSGLANAVVSGSPRSRKAGEGEPIDHDASVPCLREAQASASSPIAAVAAVTVGSPAARDSRRLSAKRARPDLDVCGALAKLEHPRRLLRADLARSRHLFRHRRLCVDIALCACRPHALARHAGRRRRSPRSSRSRSAIRSSACAAITSPSRPSWSPRPGLLLMINWDYRRRRPGHPDPLWAG